jgi:hypothetical protein
MYNSKTMTREENAKTRIDLQDEICNLKDKLNKIHFVLTELTDDYEFQNKPDIRAAVKWLDKKENSNHERNSAKWNIEYNRIMELIDIAKDYSR